MRATDFNNKLQSHAMIATRVWRIRELLSLFSHSIVARGQTFHQFHQFPGSHRLKGSESEKNIRKRSESNTFSFPFAHFPANHTTATRDLLNNMQQSDVMLFVCLINNVVRVSRTQKRRCRKYIDKFWDSLEILGKSSWNKQIPRKLSWRTELSEAVITND